MSLLTVERTPVMPHLNLRFTTLVVALLVVLAVVSQTDVDPRLVSSLVGAVALGGLLYRLISTWDETPVLVHVLSLALAALLLVGAVAQLQLGGFGPGAVRGPVPITAGTWPGIVVRTGCIVIVVFWPRWIERRRSPFRT